jgi:hypothetical protein
LLTVSNLEQHSAASGSGQGDLLGLSGAAIQMEAGLVVGDRIIISHGTALEEINEIVGFGSILLRFPLQFSHPAGSAVSRYAAPTIASTATATAAAASTAAASPNSPVAAATVLPPCFRAGLRHFDGESHAHTRGRASGSFNSATMLTTHLGLGIADCAARCLDFEQLACKAFQYKAASGLCELLAAPSPDQRLVLSNRWQHFNRALFCDTHMRRSSTAGAAFSTSAPTPATSALGSSNGGGQPDALTFPPTVRPLKTTPSNAMATTVAQGTTVGAVRFTDLPHTGQQKEGASPLTQVEAMMIAFLGLVLCVAFCFALLWRRHRTALAARAPAKRTKSGGDFWFAGTVFAESGCPTLHSDVTSWSPPAHLARHPSDDGLVWDGGGLALMADGQAEAVLPDFRARHRLLELGRLTSAQSTDFGYFEAEGASVPAPPLVWNGKGLALLPDGLEGEGIAIRPKLMVRDTVFSSAHGDRTAILSGRRASQAVKEPTRKDCSASALSTNGPELQLNPETDGESTGADDEQYSLLPPSFFPDRKAALPSHSITRALEGSDGEYFNDPDLGMTDRDSEQEMETETDDDATGPDDDATGAGNEGYYNLASSVLT